MNLKPCPFCGGEAERVVASEPQEFVLQCKGCGAASGVVVALMDEPDGHLETLWNRRAGSAPLVPVAWRYRRRGETRWTLVKTCPSWYAPDSWEYEPLVVATPLSPKQEPPERSVHPITPSSPTSGDERSNTTDASRLPRSEQ